VEKFSSGIPVLLHKHMFRHDLLNETELAEIKARTDILWVLVVRSPCDWYVVLLRKFVSFDFVSNKLITIHLSVHTGQRVCIENHITCALRNLQNDVDLDLIRM
jgi:hypothetical protein